MRMPPFVVVFALLMAAGPDGAGAAVPGARAQAAASKVIFDTDIGDDVDDAYALALLLRSPEVQVVGVTTAFGDTQLRARLVSRMLAATGHGAIPVYAGPKTEPKTAFTQMEWARGGPDGAYGDAIEFMERTIRASPGEITLVAVAPFTNLGALIRRDPEGFRKVRRVVLMGGSVDRGYGAAGAGHPEPEWNVVCDVAAAKALFGSGVPLYVMPVDSTEIPLDAARKQRLFARGSAMTGVLEELTREWSVGTKQSVPTLYDAVAAAYAIAPETCPTTPLRLEVDDHGLTRRSNGPPNAQVCLQARPEAFFDFFLPRVMR